MDLQFEPGKNIAMKTPTHEYEGTVRFYRDVIRLSEMTPSGEDETPRFEFGDKVLWLDCVAGASQAEIWLEIVTNDLVKAAAALLDESGCHRRDEIEPLPEGFNASWISNTANIIHLIAQSK